MTGSNITREHEGKHGVLTLGGSHNNVTIDTVSLRNFTFRISRSTGSGTATGAVWLHRKTARDMAEFHADDPLVRVSFGVAS